VRRTLEVAFAVLALLASAVMSGVAIAWAVQTRAVPKR
jgi:hypothetical protein